MTDAPQGIDAANVTAWFEQNIPDTVAPLEFELIAGGHSNLTFRVTDAADRHTVLRRPPLRQVLATAHDMRREHRIISALGPTDVPVPPALGLCEDDAVNGAPFYVMGYVDGQVIRDAGAAHALTIDQRRAAGDSIVDVLAAIHSVDVDAVGLGDLGRKDGYIARQLKRWYGQWEQSKTREVPAVDEVHAILSSRIPEQGSAAIVHGDYRLDNCMIGRDGRIIAVLDWEICTLGDPMADLGLLMVYWNEADDGDATLLGAPTAVEGFPKRKELLDRYAETSGRDIAAIDYYIAFGYWKLACIVEGVYARYVGGAMGQRDESAFEPFARQVERCAHLSQQLAAQLP
jgi:aminoglycoside phosphotransferase (APT) family kinase protein